MNTSQINRTILLGWNREYSAKQSFGVHMTTAFVLLVMGAMNLMRESDNSVSERFGVVMFVLAASSVIHGLIAYTKISKWSPKVSVDDSYLIIKEKLFRSAIRIPWDQIQSIEMAPYQIVFTLPEEDFDFSYRTTADTSIEIKSLIRKMAESKHIEVTGG